MYPRRESGRRPAWAVALRRPFAALVTLFAGVALAVVGVPAAASAESVPDPASDPFYTPPSSLGSYAPGTVLRSREVSIPWVTPGAASAAYQLLYRTTDATGDPVPTVTTLFIPANPAEGPRKLLSYETAEDSLTTKCAPSYTLRKGTNGETISLYTPLANGWDVVVPDYEGPHSAYAVGPMAGHASLDSIRAAENFDPAGLDGAQTPVAVQGYSGGGLAAAWTNALQPAYAPELNIVAGTAGGIAANPVTDLPKLDGSIAFGEVMMAAVGIDRAYPQFNLDSMLNAKGRAYVENLGSDAYGCGGGVGSSWFGRVSQYTHFPNAEALLDLPRVKSTLAKLNLITRPAPTAPTFYFQEILDEFVPVGPVDQLVAANCKAGTTLYYARSLTGEHLLGALFYSSQSLNYIESRFAGRPAPSTCPQG